MAVVVGWVLGQLIKAAVIDVSLDALNTAVCIKIKMIVEVTNEY